MQGFLSERRPGEEVEILSLAGEDRAQIRDRLGALGFVPGTRVKVLRKAPMGDPVEYSLRGTRVSLRRAEAAMIAVTTASPGL